MTTTEMKPVFRIEADPTFRAKVCIPIPGLEPAVIECLFRHKTRSELREFLSRASERDSEAVLAEILEGWSGVEREFTREALAALLDSYPAAGNTIFDAYLYTLTAGLMGDRNAVEV